MISKKHGVTVDCGRCEYRSSDGRHSFEVEVPLGDTESGINGTATLLCSICSGRHEVKLKDWKGAGGDPIQPSRKTQRHLVAVLDNLADQQICGNCRVCPTQVVRMVERLSRRN